MAEKKPTEATDSLTAESQPVKKDFLRDNSKPIIYTAVALVVIVGGWFGYQKLVKEPKEQKAEAAVFRAEGLFDKMALGGFNKDSVATVLNGGLDAGFAVTGVLKIMNSYSGTDAANRCQYIAGSCYLQTGDFEKAIKYLKEFDANGAYQFDITRDKMLGDAYAEQKKADDALSWYKKAAEVNDKDEPFTADALITAAGYAESIGKKQDAIDLYQKAKDNYPAYEAVTNGEVDKYLAKLGAVSN